jgi:hypothetical protein
MTYHRQEYDGKLSFMTDRWTSPNHHTSIAFCVHFEHKRSSLLMPLDIVELTKVWVTSYRVKTPADRCSVAHRHSPYNLLSRTRTTRTAAPPRKFRHTPAQPDPLLAQSTATGSPHSRWKFWKFAQLLEVHTATGSSGSLHSCWKFTQPLEVLEVCTATGSFASI